MWVLVSLHTSGWTKQVFVADCKNLAVKTWTHTKTLPGCLATVLYNPQRGVEHRYLKSESDE